MKKLYPLIALATVIIIAALYGLDHYREVREQQQAQTAHLITRCANQGLLSLFTLQATDWSKNPQQLKFEEQRLKQRVAALPAAVYDGKPFSDWQAALEVCERLTVNTNRQHKTIFRPLAEMAKKEIWSLDTAKSEQFQARRKKAIYRAKIAAEAADRYLDDLRADVSRLLEVSRISPEARALSDQQLQENIFNTYREGRFSKRRVLQYLERQEAFYQLLTDNPKGFTLRGGSLYFYNKTIHRKADDLNRSLVQGETDFFSNWSQIVAR
ncbi:hypothetical protein [Microbulbifer hydrolyticus]|uniref:Uncharacterized protein n=1 Tax=Microbulbifer hydrolyticus TaxID=48074 RepID=A0A6P1TGF5_9GAMM|nr:hypothetical protein [Microbulbifer hydrolyticus]MBB5211797.1 hypothetical protein [Microbulbifer hydrolyticus]QHQ40610.1 hypothetical protein GTQ55_17575 [Microbulbifer hydrolyticus]